MIEDSDNTKFTFWVLQKMNLPILLDVVKDQEICKILEDVFGGMEVYAEYLNHPAIQDEIKIAFIEACIDYHGIGKRRSIFNIGDVVYVFDKDAKHLVNQISIKARYIAKQKDILEDFLVDTDEGAAADAIEIEPELENFSRKRALSDEGENVEGGVDVTDEDIAELQEAFGELGISGYDEKLNRVLSNLNITEERPKKRSRK